MDPLTIFFARVFGVYFLIAAIMVFTNRKALMTGVEAMFKERFAQLLAAMISILLGLFFINLYQDWSTLASSVISLIAWIIVLKGLVYAFLPEAKLAKWTGMITEKSWYTADGVIALIVGAYLTAAGYGLL